MKNTLKIGLFGMFVQAAALTATGAMAATLTPTWTPGDGSNECARQQGFSNCVLNDSPSIIKFDNNGGLNFGDSNTNFPSVTGTELTFSNFAYNGLDLISFDWVYTAGAGDPGVTAVVLAAGGNWAWSTVFSVVGNVFSGSVSTLDAGLVNKRGIPQNVSHITLFDSYIPPATVPVPAAGFLLVGALGGLAALRRRRKAA